MHLYRESGEHVDSFRSSYMGASRGAAAADAFGLIALSQPRCGCVHLLQF